MTLRLVPTQGQSSVNRSFCGSPYGGIIIIHVLDAKAIPQGVSLPKKRCDKAEGASLSSYSISVRPK